MRRTWLVGVLTVLCMAGSGRGQGMIVIERWIEDPGMPIAPDTLPLSIESQKISVEVHDFAGTTVVEESFHNQYNRRLEGTFLFPLPEGAGVTDFGMSIDGKDVGAELLDARKAREVYEGIVRRQKDPGLLEYLGRDLFRARIFPIEPNETKRVKLEYTQGVPADQGLAKFVFPLRTRAFRHWAPSPPVRPMVPDGRGGIEGIREQPGRVGLLSLTVRLDAKAGLKSLYSPTHDIDIHRDGEHRATVGFEQKDVLPADDFILYYQLSDAMFGLNLVCQRELGDDGGTFMLLLAPKSEVREEQIAAKDIVFVFDTSGSMSGKKIEQAKGALRYCLKRLGREDRFDVVSFSSGVSAFEGKLLDATEGNVGRALEFVDKLEARGGTNIDQALETGLGMLAKDVARPAMVLFMTDGMPTAGETRPPRILENTGKANKADARLFVFGVGDDVNTMLLDRLSTDNSGTRCYVRPEEDIEESVSNLYDKIASPVLSDLRLEVDGVKISDMHPGKLSDLFRGSQLTMFGRYQGDGPARVRLRGVAKGSEQSFDYSVDFPARERGNGFVPRLWATRKIGDMLEQMRLYGQEKELVDEVVRLATRYGILTPFTSYLVLEPGVHVEGLAADRFRRDGGMGMPGARGERGAAGERGPQGAAGPAGMPGGGGGMGGATAPTTGKDAVTLSEAQRQLREAEQVEKPAGATVEQAGAKTFYLIDNVWIDSTWPKEPGDRTLVKVKYGSDAWFDLIALRDEMKDILSLGQRVKVSFGKVLLEVADEGAEKLDDAQRKALKG
ncbi:MAG: VWA domain-containing protein [Armatimonadetes bacterium]|nr:VWA domain-containing protein [Armatimonadota bacterium]